MDSADRQKKLESLRQLSRFLDTQFTGPFGIKFGLDAIVGLIPLFGDIFMSFFSFYIIYVAASIGCSPIVLVRMALNVLIENFVGLFPVAGNLFDFYWKSNVKNVRLVESYVATPVATARKSAFVLAGVLAFIFSAIFGFFVLAYYLIKFVMSLFAPL